MDRRTFLRKAAELTGISLTGISLSKLQIASVSAGLSGLIGCSNNSVNDPLTDDAKKAPASCLNGPPYVCSDGRYTCEPSLGFQCEVDFICNADPFNCNVEQFTCPDLYSCPVTVTCGGEECVFVHDQGVVE